MEQLLGARGGSLVYTSIDRVLHEPLVQAPGSQIGLVSSVKKHCIDSATTATGRSEARKGWVGQTLEDWPGRGGARERRGPVVLSKHWPDAALSPAPIIEVASSRREAVTLCHQSLSDTNKISSSVLKPQQRC